MRYCKVQIRHIPRLYYFFKRNKKDYEKFHPHEFSVFGILKNILNRKDVFIIQTIGCDKIIGYGMLRGWKEKYDTPSLGIMMDWEYRGLGLSKHLMNYLHKIAIEKNSSRVILKVLRSNTVAINLYKTLGYELSDYDSEYLIGYKTLRDDTSI